MFFGERFFTTTMAKVSKKVNKNIKKEQIQPSSLDLSLSEECYEVKHSFLPFNSKVRSKLRDLIIKAKNLLNCDQPRQ